jgi:hypothetical protein
MNQIHLACHLYRNMTGVTFKETQDHSKWAIADASSGSPPRPFVCIGGINRMTSQFTRGGSTFCVEVRSFLYVAVVVFVRLFVFSNYQFFFNLLLLLFFMCVARSEHLFFSRCHYGRT